MAGPARVAQEPEPEAEQTIEVWGADDYYCADYYCGNRRWEFSTSNVDYLYD